MNGEAASTARIFSSNVSSLQRGFGPRFATSVVAVAGRARLRYTVERAISHI
jgi:hypothetical protein